MIEVFDEWAAVAKHVDEVNRMVDIREAMRARQNMYRQELENQTREMQNRLKANKNANTEAERLLLQQHLIQYLREQIGSVKESENGELQKEKQKKAIAMNIMNENARLKNRAMEEMKEIEKQEALAVIQSMKQTQEEEKIRAENERRNRLRIADTLKLSYDTQETIKKQERSKLKELDKIYCEQEKTKLMQDEQQRRQVILYINLVL
jgi:hypothetical protein